MKKFIIFALVAGVSIVCYGKKKYAITMSGESLTTLTQVTDNEEPCLDPFGGDNGTALFFSVRENKKFYNIYKKDNPFSAAMSQKTSGKNFNRHPCFNAATGKISFSCKQDGAGSSDIFTMFDNKGKALSQITESADTKNPARRRQNPIPKHRLNTSNNRTIISLNPRKPATKAKPSGIIINFNYNLTANTTSDSRARHESMNCHSNSFSEKYYDYLTIVF